jgi:gp48
MITAEQARELNPKGRIEEYKTFLEKRIREAALKGEDFVLIRNEPYSNWLGNGHKLDDLDDRAAVEVLKELRQNGFDLKYFQYDGSQFSDYGMEISWGKKCAGG